MLIFQIAIDNLWLIINIMKTELNEIEKLVANNFKILRKIKGLTLQDLSLMLGVTYQQVQKYESGSSRIPLDKLVLLSNHLNVKMEFFVKKFEI